MRSMTQVSSCRCLIAPPRRYLSRRIGYQAADDSFSEVRLQVLRSLKSYGVSHSDARPWRYGIARNTVRAHLRAGTRERRGGNQVADPWGDVDSQLDATRWHAELHATVAALPERDREVLLLVA